VDGGLCGSTCAGVMLFGCVLPSYAAINYRKKREEDDI